MSNFFRYEEGLDVGPLVETIKKYPNLWKDITIRQEFEGTAHKDTETIYIRGPLEWTREGYQEQTDAVNYLVPRDLIQHVYPFVRKVQSMMTHGTVGYVMIVNLKAGGYIKVHIDQGKYADTYERFHVPLITNDECTFLNGDEMVRMKAGELWEFNHRDFHSFNNGGETDRWHLIIDAY